jgi:hypothetical protein
MSPMRALTLLYNLTRARIMHIRNPCAETTLTLHLAERDLDNFDAERGYYRNI